MSASPAPAALERPSCGANVVELAGVTKEYPGGVAALRGIDLRIREGELLGIVGPSGSGKSTLLHIVGTLDRPTAGTVAIAGHDIAALSDRRLSALRARHVGFVFQSFHLVPGVSARDNVAEGLLYSGLPRAVRRRRAQEALARVGLADRTGHRPHELSGGQKQRVAIARAVVGEPALLLADEPTGALDSASGDAVMALLHELNSEGATIAVITHDMEIAESLPRQVRLRDGRITADTTAVRTGVADTTAVRTGVADPTAVRTGVADPTAVRTGVADPTAVRTGVADPTAVRTGVEASGTRPAGVAPAGTLPQGGGPQ